jgi:AcrR family transcriptional regulator
MEAVTELRDAPGHGRELAGDKATRIVEAMRASVALRGFAGSTFDHVAREAGVSRGLLHYYFQSKERLLVEAVRRDCELRHQRLESAVEPAHDANEVLAALVGIFEDFLGAGPGEPTMFFEVITLAQRNEEIAAELAELGRRMRTLLAGVLRSKADAGVIPPSADPEVTAALLFVLADGIVVRRLSEPELDIAPIMVKAVAAARALLA